METLQQNIWEEKNLTEQNQSCLNSNANGQNVITNGTETDSTLNPCEDIGKLERRRLQLNAACRKWYWKNREQRVAHNKKRYHDNRIMCNNCSKNWKLKNEKYVSQYKKQYRLNNKDKIREYHTKYCTNRLKTDTLFKISCGLRTRLNVALKDNQKSGSSVRDLGCSISDFKRYIEGKFQPRMTWKNWGIKGWHLDHIIPLSSFNLSDREQFLKACHYTNYQPLWAVENIRKGSNSINSIAGPASSGSLPFS